MGKAEHSANRTLGAPSFTAIVLRVLITLAMLLPLASGVEAAAEFSADFIARTEGEEDTMGKIFVKQGKVRQEITQEGQREIMIIRPDKGVTWAITPEEHMYMEFPYEPGNRALSEWSVEKESGRTKAVGEETVSGMACRKYEAMEAGEKTYYWVAKKLSFPIKIQDKESSMEYRNIKEGGVDDIQFELPSGLEKMLVSPVPSEAGWPPQ